MKRILLLCLAIGGCGEFDPLVGEDREDTSSTCTLEDSDPAVPSTWGEVKLVFERRCGCHVAQGGLGQVVGRLDLRTVEDIMSGGARSEGKVVVPGDPCASTVVLKTLNPPPFGARMPFNGTVLPDSDRQIIIDWIAEGAEP